MRPNFFHHLHPPTIPARQARLRYTLGAGGLAVFFTLVLVASGILEMFYYIPTEQEAAHSVQTIAYLVPYGGLVRNLHYWAAQLLIVVAGVHLLRVIFSGAYTPPRRFNYLLGLGLFVSAVLLDFSGYVLRWDEGVRWALVAGTNLVKTIPLVGGALYRLLVGAEELGQPALIRFYAWHIFGLTLVAIVLGGWHIFRVRRDGGIAVPPAGQRKDNTRIDRFELVRREGLAMLLASAALMLLAIFAPAPIAQPINPDIALGGEARAPWFFLWVQQLLKLGDPFLWGVLVPALMLLLLALIPYMLPSPSPAEQGAWFPPSGRAAQIMTAALAGLVLVLTLIALGEG